MNRRIANIFFLSFVYCPQIPKFIISDLEAQIIIGKVCFVILILLSAAFLPDFLSPGAIFFTEDRLLVVGFGMKLLHFQDYAQIKDRVDTYGGVYREYLMFGVFNTESIDHFKEILERLEKHIKESESSSK